MLKKLLYAISLTVLLANSSCLTKVKIVGFKEDGFTPPQRIYTLAQAAKDDDLTEFQSKLSFKLQDYLLSKNIKNDYYISKYSYDKIDSTGYAKMEEFKPTHYFEMGSTTESSTISTSVAEAGVLGLAREGAEYEILLRDYPSKKIVWRAKLSVSSVLGAANGQKKTIKKIIDKFNADQLF